MKTIDKITTKESYKQLLDYVFDSDFDEGSNKEAIILLLNTLDLKSPLIVQPKDEKLYPGKYLLDIITFASNEEVALEFLKIAQKNGAVFDKAECEARGTLVHLTVAFNYCYILRFLIEDCHLKVDSVRTVKNEEQGQTALHQIIQYDTVNSNLVQQLLNCGADPLKADASGKLPIESISKDHPAYALMLNSKKAEPYRIKLEEQAHQELLKKEQEQNEDFLSQPTLTKRKHSNEKPSTPKPLKEYDRVNHKQKAHKKKKQLKTQLLDEKPLEKSMLIGSKTPTEERKSISIIDYLSYFFSTKNSTDTPEDERPLLDKHKYKHY